MREKDEMPFFNHNSSGIRFLLISLTIYLWHSTGKKRFFFSLHFLHIDGLCNKALCNMLTPLSGQSIKNQKQDNDKESENLPSQMYLHLIQVK